MWPLEKAAFPPTMSRFLLHMSDPHHENLKKSLLCANLGLDELFLLVVLHVDVNLASLCHVHQFVWDGAPHDGREEGSVGRVVVGPEVAVVDGETFTPHLQHELAWRLKCSEN